MKEKDNVAYHLLRCSKNRLYKRPMEHTITIDDIKVPEVCPVFNEPLKFGTKYVPSIDRIDNTKGYIPDNIQVISRRANIMKHDASKEELVKFAIWVLKSYSPEHLSPSEREEQ